MPQADGLCTETEANQAYSFSSEPDSISGPGGVVGSTAEELESFNELITFDHQYYKIDNKPAQESSVQVATVDGLHSKAEQAVAPLQGFGMDNGLEGHVLSMEDMAAISEQSIDLTDLEAFLESAGLCGTNLSEGKTVAFDLQAEAEAAFAKDIALKADPVPRGCKRKAAPEPEAVSLVATSSPVPSEGEECPRHSGVASSLCLGETFTLPNFSERDTESALSPSSTTSAESLSPLTDWSEDLPLKDEDCLLFSGLLLPSF